MSCLITSIQKPPILWYTILSLPSKGLIKMNISRFARLTQRRGKTFLSKNVSSIQVIVFYYIVMTVLSLALFYLPFFR